MKMQTVYYVYRPKTDAYLGIEFTPHAAEALLKDVRYEQRIKDDLFVTMRDMPVYEDAQA